MSNQESQASLDLSKGMPALQPILPKEDIDKLNKSIDVDDWLSNESLSRWEANKIAYENGDTIAKDREDNAQQWGNYYDKVDRCTFSGDCDLTLKGEEGDWVYDITKNNTTDWTYDSLEYNKPLLESLFRTYGGYDDYGKKYSPKDLIDKFMRDQTFNLVNITKFGFDVAKLTNSTEQQIKDFGLQLLTYEKVKATEEGSRDLLTQTSEVVAGAASDLTNLLFGGRLAAEGTKIYTKKKLKDYLKNFISKQIVKTSGKFGTIGALYGGVDNTLRQVTKISAELQDGQDWGQFMMATGLGFGVGSALGFLVGGASQTFNDLANKYMVKNNLTNKDFLKEFRKTVKNETALYKWLKNLGWSKSEAKNELKYLEEQGINFNTDKGVWVNKEGQNYLPPMIAKRTEDAYFKGEDVRGTIESTNTVQKGQRIFDDEYVSQVGKDVGIPWSATGNKIFQFIDKNIGGLRNIAYGTDSVLVRHGLRKYANAIGDTEASIQMNTGRIAGKLKLNKTDKKALEGIEEAWRKGKPLNPTQKEFMDTIKNLQKDQLRKSVRSKVITLDEYKKFIKDESYIPRVWNYKTLTTDKGAKEFSTFLSDLWTKDPASVRKVLDNITGESKLTDDIIDKKFEYKAIANSFRNKVDKETNVKRSSHLENTRKIRLSEDKEHLLDPFMASFEDRWTMWFNDVITRNEFASRFGAKDQRIKNKIKQLTNEKNTNYNPRAAAQLREVYFTHVKDADNSETIRKLMESSWLSKAVSKVNAWQTIDKMGLAQVLNATQVFVNGSTLLAKSGKVNDMLSAPFKATIALVKSLVKTKRDLNIINRAGVLGEMDINQIATENMRHSRIFDVEGRGKFTKHLNALNDPTEFLRLTGFIGVERMNRSAAAIMSRSWIDTLHSRLQRQLLQDKRFTKETVKLERQLKDLGILDPLKKNLSENDYSIGGFNMNKQINFSGESHNLPLAWHNPYGKLLMKFKSFMFYQSRFIKRNIADPLFKDGNAGPLLTYLATTGVAGNTIADLRDKLKGKDVIDENRTPLEYVIRGIVNSGGAGLFYETLADFSDKGKRALPNILGPTPSETMDLVQDVTQGDIKGIIKTALPNVPGNVKIKEWIDDWTLY